jgi:hypothetical protein
MLLERLCLPLPKERYAILHLSDEVVASKLEIIF